MDKKRILIVEDEAAISKALSCRLEKLGFKVSVAQDGQEGLEEVKRRRPDLLILDLVLPALPGEEVCKAIRESDDEGLAALPIIMLTAKSSDADHCIGKVLGANSYVTKPFRTDSLLKEIRRLIGAVLIFLGLSAFPFTQGFAVQ